MSGIFFRMLMTFLQRGCQNCIIRVQANSLRKSFAFLKRCILYRSRTLTKKLPPIFEFFSAQLSKLYSTCLDDYFERRNAYLETEFTSSFSDIERKFFSLLPEFFGLSCQNCILSVQRKIKGKTVFRKKMYFFSNCRDWDKVFTIFVWTFLAALSNLRSRRQSKQFEEYVFWKTCDLSLWDNEEKVFALLSKSKRNPMGCQSYFLCLPKKILGKNSSFWKLPHFHEKVSSFFGNLLRHRDETFLPVGQKFTGWLSKLHSPCP